MNQEQSKNMSQYFYRASAADFMKIPGNSVAYWLSPKLLESFVKFDRMLNVSPAKIGMRTGDNDNFLRHWHEVSQVKTNLDCRNKDEAAKSNKKWFPYNKGGEFRKWYGNHQYLVNWENDGRLIKTNTLEKYPQLTWDNMSWKISNEESYFLPSVSWSDITSSDIGFRYYPAGFIYDVTGMSAFPSEDIVWKVIGFANSSVAKSIVRALNPTMHFQARDFNSLPCPSAPDSIKDAVELCIRIAKEDWDQRENSWGFRSFCLLGRASASNAISESYRISLKEWQEFISSVFSSEEKINETYVNKLQIQTEFNQPITLKDITLTCNPHYRYGGNRSEEELESLLQCDTLRELISYAIGCMMGRYSLDEPGLIYAHAGNVGFEPGRYATFPADADGIVPITDELWFADDACSRIREFLRAVWGPDTLDENCAWLAESLGQKPAETPDETIRRYLADKFFKDHLQTYKKRPIYWLFSSGKQGAFQALVYLHRYFDGTLARLRAEYVVPLTGKIQSRIEMLQKDAATASSTAARNKLAKEVEKLKKKHVELLAYDEQLRHYADMRITLDLDDGVKVNYGKFGALLAEVKAVTGGAGDE